MKGIDNIKAVISEEAQATAQKIAADSDARCEKILFDGKVKAAEHSQTASLTAEKERKDILDKANTDGRLSISRAVLMEKQTLLKKAFSMAQERLETLPEGEFSKLVSALICKNAPDGGEILLNSRCYAQYGAAILQACGTNYTLGQADDSIADGAVVRQGKIDINCTISAIVTSLYDSHGQRVSEILFRG